MNEVLEINGKNFVSYDLLCNIGSLAGYGNLAYLKELYPDMQEIRNGAYNNPNFKIESDVDIFLEKDNLGAEAIWLRVGSRLEEEISVCLENEPVLSQKHLLKAENDVLNKEFSSRFTVLQEIVSDMSDKTQERLLNAIEKSDNNFDWKKVISNVIQDPEEFYIHPIDGSSEVSVVIKMDDKDKAKFEKEIDKEAQSILSPKNKMRP